MKKNPLSSVSLETILTGKKLADLDASPLQLAIVRAAGGRPLAGILGREAMLDHFGVEELAAVLPTLIVLICGVRSGKTFLACAAMWQAALTAKFPPWMKDHEVARLVVVSPRVTTTGPTFRMFRGIGESSPLLRTCIEGEPTSNGMMIRRPDGRRVEVLVVAASAGGITFRNVWLVGFVIEEVAGFGAEIDGSIINAEELLRAGETRLLPGCQGWIISSPNGPSGLLYDLYQAHFGKPGRVLCVHAPTEAMNPAIDRETIAAVRARDPDAAAREYDAAWTDPVTSFFDLKMLDAATRKTPLERPRDGRMRYFAATDPATRGNAWTLCIGHSEEVSKDVRRLVIDGAWQWIGSKTKPLSPSAVLLEIAGICARYGIASVLTDQWSNDALRDIARGHKLTMIERRATTEEQIERYTAIRTLFAESRIELPPVPVLRADLAGVRRRVLSNGIRIDLTHTPDGRHCDFAPAIALLSGEAPLSTPEPIRRPTRHDPAAGYRLGNERGFG